MFKTERGQRKCSQGDPPSVPRRRPKWSAKACQDFLKYLQKRRRGSQKRHKKDIISEVLGHSKRGCVWQSRNRRPREPKLNPMSDLGILSRTILLSSSDLWVECFLAWFLHRFVIDSGMDFDGVYDIHDIFWIAFGTFLRSARFMKIFTAPKQEHDFLGFTTSEKLC